MLSGVARQRRPDALLNRPIRAPRQQVDLDAALPARMLHVPGFIGEVVDYTLSTAPYPERVLAFCGALSSLTKTTVRLEIPRLRLVIPSRPCRRPMDILTPTSLLCNRSRRNRGLVHLSAKERVLSRGARPKTRT